jgi:hypothetical protein
MRSALGWAESSKPNISHIIFTAWSPCWLFMYS